MKKEDVKIGMKVVPFQKTIGDKGLDSSKVYIRAKEKNQPFLYVVWGNDFYFKLSDINDIDKRMDIFDAEDFDPYIEANPPIPYDYTIAVNVLKKDVKKIKKLIKSEKSLLKYTVNHNDDILSKIAKFKTRKIQLKQAILFLTTQVYL